MEYKKEMEMIRPCVRNMDGCKSELRNVAGMTLPMEKTIDRRCNVENNPLPTMSHKRF